MRLYKRWLVLLLLVVGTSGCISIEQEIFLQPDGSGDVLLHIGLPDFSDAVKSSSLSANDPLTEMEKFKKEVVEKLPPTIKLIEAKQTQRHGTNGFYAVFRFQDIREVQSLMNQALQKSTEGMPPKENAAASKPPEWSLNFEKQNGLTHFTQTFFADMSDAKAETKTEAKVAVKTNPSPKPKTTVRKTGRKTTGARAETNDDFDLDLKVNGVGMGKNLEGFAEMFLAAIKFRFVLHTPTPIKDSNADIVLNGKTALWDCSLAAFAKVKRPIEMKVSF